MTDPLFVYLADPPPPRPSGHLALNRSPAEWGRYGRGFEKLYDDDDGVQLGLGPLAGHPLQAEKHYMVPWMVILFWTGSPLNPTESNWMGGGCTYNTIPHQLDILSGLESYIIDVIIFIIRFNKGTDYPFGSGLKSFVIDKASRV